MKATDLREKTPEDLREVQKSLVRDVFQNRLKNFTNRLDDTSAIRKTRRDLARVITVLRERDIGLERPLAPVKAGEASGEAQPEKAPKKKVAPKVEAKAAEGSSVEGKPKKSKTPAAAEAASADEGAAKKSGAEPAQKSGAEPAQKKPSTKAKKGEAKP